jgi:hypothetical protein
MPSPPRGVVQREAFSLIAEADGPIRVGAVHSEVERRLNARVSHDAGVRGKAARARNRQPKSSRSTSASGAGSAAARPACAADGRLTAVTRRTVAKVCEWPCVSWRTVTSR